MVTLGLRRFASGLIGLLVFAVVLSACSPAPEPSKPASSQKESSQPPSIQKAPSQPKPGGVLRIGAETEPLNLDPHTLNNGWELVMAQHVYSTLVRPDQNLLPVPDLAESWEMNDPTTLSFKLRRGVKFHNGRELVADDVKYSFERIKDPKTVAPYADFLRSVASIETNGTDRVVLKLKEPDVSIINNLAMPSMSIVPKEVVEQQGNLKTTMVGTGPFKFKEMIPGQKLVLVKNPDYFVAGQPLLDQVEFIPLLNETARTNALRSGDVDLIVPAPAKDLKSLKSDQNAVVTGGENLNFISLAVNTKREPLNDVRVRQALAYAIDRSAVVENAYDGTARPLWGGPLIPPFWAGSDERVYSADLNKAKQLLAEAGHPNGFKTTLMTATGMSYQDTLAPVVKAELQKIGVDVQITPRDAGVSFREFAEGNFDLYPIRWWGADFIDPDGALSRIFHSQGTRNRSKYANPELDKLLVRATTLTSSQERKAAYAEAMRIIARDAPYIFLVSLDRYQAMKSYVKGYVPHPGGTDFSLRQVWLDK